MKTDQTGCKTENNKLRCMMDAFNNFLNAALEICESAWGKAHRRNSLRSVGRDGVSQKKTSITGAYFPKGSLWILIGGEVLRVIGGEVLRALMIPQER
ncbi:hypothetical protein MTP99_015594 [Tenebrio molitor]|jgi:hypothetical protein|nr:hypothetical protein MTP99_015594 [Tenebrio molitor]